MNVEEWNDKQFESKNKFFQLAFIILHVTPFQHRTITDGINELGQRERDSRNGFGWLRVRGITSWRREVGNEYRRYTFFLRSSFSIIKCVAFFASHRLSHPSLKISSSKICSGCYPGVEILYLILWRCKKFLQTVVLRLYARLTNG